MVDLRVDEPVTASLRRVSWGAILAGVALALVVHLLLTLLGTGIGLASLAPATGDSPDAASLGIGAAIWWAISGIIAAYAGGWVAARLAGIPSRGEAMLHGLATWAATMIVIVLLLSSAVGAIIGGAFQVLGGAAQAVGQTAGAVAPAVVDAAGGPMADIAQEARSLVAGDDRSAGGDALAGSLARIFAAGEEGSPAIRQNAIDLLVRQGGLTAEEADARITQWQQSFNDATAQAEQSAREAAEEAASAASMAAIYAFIALLLGGVAGALGGRAGMPKSTAVLRV